MAEEEKEIDYESLAQEIFNEQNRVRADPSSYIEKLKRAEKFFKDKIFRHPAEIPIETNEGLEGVKNAIDFLSKQKPLPELELSEELTKAAKDHAKDLDVAITSVMEGNYKNIEFIVCENNSIESATFDYYEKVKKNSNVKIVTYKDKFNYSKINI